MMIELDISKEEYDAIIKEWDSIPDKYNTFKNMTHHGSTNFRSKYPKLLNLLKVIDSKMK